MAASPIFLSLMVVYGGRAHLLLITLPELEVAPEPRGLLWMDWCPGSLFGCCCLGISLYHHPRNSFSISFEFSVLWNSLFFSLLNYCAWLVVGWIKNSRLEIIFSHNFRHYFIEYLMPCGYFVWKLEICFFLPSSLKVFQTFFLTVLELPVMCFLWVCFSPFCVCLVGPLEFSWSISFTFSSPPPPRNSYPILDLLDWFYNFLFSLFHLFIFFSLLWISSTLFSNPCVFHFCYILDFQSSFFFFWMLPLLKVFYYCFMDFFLFLKILMIVFEIVTFAKVLYPSSCFSPCSFVLYALL